MHSGAPPGARVGMGGPARPPGDPLGLGGHSPGLERERQSSHLARRVRAQAAVSRTVDSCIRGSVGLKLGEMGRKGERPGYRVSFLSKDVPSSATTGGRAALGPEGLGMGWASVLGAVGSGGMVLEPYPFGWMLP